MTAAKFNVNGLWDVFQTVAALKAAAKPQANGAFCFVLGYYAAGDGGGGPYSWDSASTATANNGTIIQRDAGGTGRWNFAGNALNAATFGAKGDDSTDDTAAVQAADTAAAGGVLFFTPGKTYRCLSQVTCSCEWNLSGARVHLVLDGNERGIVMDHDSWLHSGVIKKTSTGTVSSGEYQCHVIVGTFAGTAGGKHGVRVTDLHLEHVGTVANLNGIAVAGDSHNIEVGRISTDDNAYLGRVVMLHWGNLDGYASTVTGHPHNVWVHDIDGGEQTLNSQGQAIVYLSGCYDCTVERINADRVGYYFVVEFAGDHGFQYADAATKKAALKGNRILNSTCMRVDANGGAGVYVASKSTVHGSIWYSSVVIDGVKVFGAATSGMNGIEINHAGKAVVQNCVVVGCENGIGVGEGCRGSRVVNNECQGNGTYGVYVTSNTTPPRDVEVSINYCYENGTAGIFTSAAYRTTIKDNELGDRDGTDSTQDYGIQIGTADRGHEIVNNHFHDYTVAGIQTASSSGQFLDVISGNTFDDLTAPIVGQDFLPYARVPTPDGTTILWHGVGNATPEASVTAPPGSTCTNTANGKHYTKETGTGNTGWVVTGTQT